MAQAQRCDGAAMNSTHQVGSVVPGASLTVSVDPSNPKNVRP